MKCEHEFAFHVEIYLFEDKPGNGSADIQGACKKCRARVVFQGAPIGIGGSPTIDPSGHELRLPVTIGDAKYMGGSEFRLRGCA